MDADQFRNITYPIQPRPEVFDPVGAKNQERIFRRQGPQMFTAQGGGGQALGQASGIEGKREIPRCDAPLDLYDDMVLRPFKDVLVVVTEEGCLLRTGEVRVRSVSLCDQCFFSSQYVRLADQDIQVAELPQRKVSVDRRGQSRPFERNSRNPARLE